MPGCDTQVTLDIEVDTKYSHGEADVNANERVIISPTSVSFEPWKYTDTFEISIGNAWDTNLPNTFQLKYTLSGTDANAFNLNREITEVEVWYSDEVFT